MAIDIGGIYGLNERALKSANTQSALEFNQEIDLITNEALRIDEEAEFQEAKIGLNSRINEFKISLSEVNRNRSAAVNEFDEQTRRDLDFQLTNRFSKEKAAQFKLDLDTQVANLKLQAISFDRKVSADDLTNSESIHVENLRVAANTKDPGQISDAKLNLSLFYEDLNRKGFLADDVFKLKTDRIDTSIYQNQLEDLLVNKETRIDEIGEEQYLDLLRKAKDNKNFAKLDVKTQQGFDRVFGATADSIASVDTNSAYTDASFSVSGALSGAVELSTANKVLNRYYEKVERVLPKLKGAARSQLKERISILKTKQVGLSVVQADPSVLLGSKSDEFVSRVFGGKNIDSIDKSSPSYLKALGVFFDFRKTFGNFKTQNNVRAYTLGIGKGAPQSDTDFNLTSNAQKESYHQAENIFNNLSDKTKGAPGATQLKQLIGQITNATLLEEKIFGEKKLTPKEAKGIYGHFFNLVKGGEYNDAITLFNGLVGQNINVFSNFEEKSSFTSKNISTHFSLLGQVGLGLNKTANRSLTDGYLGFLSHIGGKAGSETQGLSKDVYKSVKDKLTKYVLKDKSAANKIKELTPNRDGALSFLSSVFAYHAVAEGAPGLITDVETFDNILDAEGTIAGLFEALLGTTHTVSDRYSINKDKLGKKNVIIEKGEVSATIGEDGETLTGKTAQTSKVKSLAIHNTISNSLNPFDISNYAGKAQSSPAITSKAFALLKYAFPNDVVHSGQLSNLSVRSGTVYYSQEEGIDKPLQVRDPETRELITVTLDNKTIDELSAAEDSPDTYFSALFKNIYESVKKDFSQVDHVSGDEEGFYKIPRVVEDDPLSPTSLTGFTHFWEQVDAGPTINPGDVFSNGLTPAVNDIIEKIEASSVHQASIKQAYSKTSQIQEAFKVFKIRELRDRAKEMNESGIL